MDRPKSDLKFVFLAALDRSEPGEKRLAYLDEACGGDAELRQRCVEALSRRSRPQPMRCWESSRSPRPKSRSPSPRPLARPKAALRSN